MTTGYTPILKLALPVTGELNGTWGTVVNDNITSMVEQAVAGLATINTWTTNSHTLTSADGTTSESRCAMLVIDDDGAGNPSAAATVICPTATKSYIVRNICGQTVTVKTSAGTGVAVPNNQAALVFCDGTNVVTGAFNGDVVGPATATNNAIVTFDGTTGKLIKDNSGATISAGVITATGFSGPLNGTVGATTPATGAFTTASATTGNITTVNATTVNATTVDTTNIEVTNLKAKDGTAAGSIADITGVVTITTLAATTGNITTVNATTVDTTNLEVTNLKAKDGTSAGSIADATGVVTLASSVLTTTDINGGTIDATSIGATTAAAGSFTNLSVSGTTSFDGSEGTNGQVLTSAGTGNTPTWTTPTTGTVTSVGGTGTVNGITLTGTVTTSGNLTLGGTLSGVSLTSQVSGTLPVANGGTGITSLGTGVATWLGTPSSANLAAAVSDETGSGALVFGTTPVLTGVRVTVSALGTLTTGTTTIDLATAQVFTATITAANTITVAFSNAPSAGQTQVVLLRLTNAGGGTIVWPAATKFTGGTAPTLTASGVDVLGVYYDVTTSTYMVFVIGLDVKVP